MEFFTSMDGWFWGNIIIGGLFGSTTDAVSGAVNKYSPDQYFVTLTPEGNERGVLDLSQEVQKYVVLNYDELKLAVASNAPSENEEFQGLAELLEIADDDSSARQSLANMIAESTDPVDAARRVWRQFGSE